MIRHILRSIATCAFAAALATGATAGYQEPKETLTNETVAAMVKAGLSPGLIVAKINTSVPKFDVTTGELIRLRR